MCVEWNVCTGPSTSIKSQWWATISSLLAWFSNLKILIYRLHEPPFVLLPRVGQILLDLKCRSGDLVLVLGSLMNRGLWNAGNRGWWITILLHGALWVSFCSVLFCFVTPQPVAEFSWRAPASFPAWWHGKRVHRWKWSSATLRSLLGMASRIRKRLWAWGTRWVCFLTQSSGCSTAAILLFSYPNWHVPHRGSLRPDQCWTPSSQRAHPQISNSPSVIPFPAHTTPCTRVPERWGREILTCEKLRRPNLGAAFGAEVNRLQRSSRRHFLLFT